MFQRLDISPVLRDQWRSTVYSKDTLGNDQFLFADCLLFYVLPVPIALVLALNARGHVPAFDFLLKFSILLMPLMLNLFFHIFRLKAELKIPSNLQGKDSPNFAVGKDEALKFKALNQLTVHILYLANACFGCAVLCGLALATMPLLVKGDEQINPTACYALSVLVYSVGVHVFLVGLQVLRVTYNLVITAE